MHNLKDKDVSEYLDDFFVSKSDLLKPGEHIVIERQINDLWTLEIKRFKANERET